MAKVFKAIIVGALVVVSLVTLLPFVGITTFTPFVGLFGIASPTLAALVGGGILGGLSALLAPSLDMRDVRARQRISIDPNATMKWVFGETSLATDVIYAAQHGADDKFVTHIIAGAGHLIDSFGDLYVNDELVPFTGDAASGVWLNALWRQTRLGTEVQTELLDIDANDDFATTLWPADADGLGMAYYRLRWDITHEKISSGVPTRITQIVKGGPVYDPRLDGTRGGVGAHRADDQTTWEYNDGTDDIGANWALIVLRYLIGWQINSKLVIGMGIDPDDIDMDQAMAAANVCEALVDGVPRYRIGGMLPVTNDHPSIIRQLEGAINGKVAVVGGMYYIWAPNDDLTPFSTIDEGDLLRDAGVIFQPSGPMEKLFNTGRGSFISSLVTDLFNLVPYPDVEEATAVTEDGGVRVKNHDLSMVQDVSIAERVVRGIVRRSRFGATWRFAMGPKGLTFQPFSVTTLNCQETNFTNVTVRIIDMAYSVSGAVVMEVIEEDSSIYDTTAPLGTPVTQLDPGGFDVNVKIAVTGLASADISILGSDGTGSDGFSVTWNDPGAWVAETQVQFKVSTDTDWTAVPATRIDVQTAIIVPVERLTLYDIRARHITRSGVVGDFVAIADTAGDVQITPLPPTALAAASIFDGVLLTWTDPPLRKGKFIEIHASDENDRATAVQIATSPGTPYIEQLRENPRTRFYWVRTRSEEGLVSTFEPNTTTTTATATPRPSKKNFVIDPDFDKSTGFDAAGGGFWETKVTQGTAPVQTGVINFITAGGANSSNAIDIIHSGGSGTAKSSLEALRRHRINHGIFEFRLRYQTFGALDSTDHVIAVGVIRHTVEIGGTGNFFSAGDIQIPRSVGAWASVVMLLDIPDDPTYQYMSFLIQARPGSTLDTFRLDSIFVHPARGAITLADLTDVNTAAVTNRFVLVADGVDYEGRRLVSEDVDFTATDKFLGRTTGGAGDGEELTGTQATAMLDVFTSGLKGLAPLSGGSATEFLRADGVWAVPAGSTVSELSDLTDVNTSTPTNRNFLIADGVDWESRAAVAADIEFALTDRFLGRTTAGGGDGEELTGTQATVLLDVFTSALKGLAPLSGGGSTNFLRADGTWAVPPGAAEINDLTAAVVWANVPEANIPTHTGHVTGGTDLTLVVAAITGQTALLSGLTNVDEFLISDLGVIKRMDASVLLAYINSNETNDLTAAVVWANVPNANITVGSVTQHEAALTILETQITDGLLLARLAANEAITGNWDFDGLVKIKERASAGADTPAYGQPWVKIVGSANELWFTDDLGTDFPVAPLFPETTEETAASLTITDYHYPVGHMFRYGVVGDDATDNTAAFNAILIAGGFTIRVPAGIYQWTSAIEATDGVLVGANTHIICEAGVTMRCTGMTAARGWIRFRDVANCSIDGGNSVWEYITKPISGEFKHIFALRGASNITMRDVAANKSGGDGFTIGNGVINRNCSNIYLENISADDNRRGGLSITAGKDIFVNGAVLRNSDGTAPQFGLDVEPNSSYDLLDGIVLNNIHTESNTGVGLVIDIHNLPEAIGTHDGGASAATLSDSGESWATNEFVGRVIVNLDDGSSGPITANTGTTITAALTGGTDNDWDVGDSYNFMSTISIVVQNPVDIESPIALSVGNLNIKQSFTVGSRITGSIKVINPVGIDTANFMFVSRNYDALGPLIEIEHPKAIRPNSVGSTSASLGAAFLVYAPAPDTGAANLGNVRITDAEVIDDRETPLVTNYLFVDDVRTVGSDIILDVDFSLLNGEGQPDGDKMVDFNATGSVEDIRGLIQHDATASFTLGWFNYVRTVTNAGAGGLVIVTLDSIPVDGPLVTFEVKAAQLLRLDPDVASHIQPDSEGVGLYIQSNDIGAKVTLKRTSTTEWTIVEMEGIWRRQSGITRIYHPTRFFDVGETDYIEIAPDGVDINITTFQVSDVNMLETGTRFLLPSASEVSLSTVNHPFQIGLDSGLNLRLDNNEILAVNNGVASVMNLQTDGGDIQVGVSAPATINFLDLYLASGGLRLFDSTATDNMRFHHDGARGVISTSAGSGSIRFEPENDTLILLGAMFFEERAAALGFVAGLGLVWVKNTIPNELWFTDDVGTDFLLGGVPTAVTVANEGADTTSFPTFVTAATGDLGPKTNAGLTFNALTADLNSTLIAGIANANLLDKAAAETVSGGYTFTGINFQQTNPFIFTDGTELRFGSGSDVRFDYNPTTTDFTLADTITGTTWNITGFADIAAGTVDVDFDAITGTSYGGILEANLVDKIVNEIVTGKWTMGGDAEVLIVGDSSFTDKYMSIRTLTAGGGLGLDTAPGSGDILLRTGNAKGFRLDVGATDGLWPGNGTTAMDVEPTGETSFPEVVSFGAYIQHRTATTAQLVDITHAVNTDAGKIQGAQVFNTTTNTSVFAAGNTNGAHWHDGAGTDVHTPV